MVAARPGTSGDGCSLRARVENSIWQKVWAAVLGDHALALSLQLSSRDHPSALADADGLRGRRTCAGSAAAT